MEPMEFFRALLAEPVALVMALVAVGCAIATVSSGTFRVRDRLVSAALALISTVTAWMMATRWQWPR
jgi:hypothetical protein